MSHRSPELRVERHRGMIDVYLLVGLDRWESDPVRIQRAIAEARAMLSQNRRQASEHSQLSGYVTEAERLLTDPIRKQRYDLSLRSVIDAEVAASLQNEPTPPEVKATVVAVTATHSARPVSMPGVPVPAATKTSAVTSKPAAVSVPRPQTVARITPARQSLRSTAIESLRDGVSGVATWLHNWWEALHGGAPVKFSLAIAFAVGVVGLLLSRLDWNKTFPESTIAPRAAGEQSLTATLSPKPAVQSIPGQRVGVPRTVPGLDSIEGYSPTLNSALTQIVFAAGDSQRNTPDLDLYLATRGNPSESFQEPKRLDSCSSPDYETDPTLSPDGLELVFVRVGAGHPRLSLRTLRVATASQSSPAGTSIALMRSLRASLTDSFPEPTLLAIPKLPADSEVTYDSPQLLANGGTLTVRVTRATANGPETAIFQSRRSSLDSPFEPAEPVPVFVEASRHFLTSDGTRAFVCRHYAIQLSCRPTISARFSAPGQLSVLNATRIGNAEGPIWVSPAEDFLFYCVTVTNSSHQQRRSLRQVRIR